MARPICRWRCSKRRPASRSFATCRPMAAGRRSPPCSATTRRSSTQTVRRRSSTSKPASCARWRRSAATRSKVLPDVPTLKELGYDVEYYLWVGIFAPKGTPAKIAVATLSAAHRQGRRLRSVQVGDHQSRPGIRLSQCQGFRQVLGGRCQALRRGGEIDRPRGLTDKTRVKGHELTRRSRGGRRVCRVRRC